MIRSLVVLVCLLVPSLGQAQQIYTCKDARGQNTYQQTPCEEGTREHAARAYKPVADAPQHYAPPAHPARPTGPATGRASSVSQSSGSSAVIGSATVANGAEGAFVRCVGADGTTRIRPGTTCPTRKRTGPHQPGMVTDVRTGQQRFMVPGGGNGMIDPRTGQRHELISPPPTVTYRDRAEAVSGAEACADARARYEQVMSDFNRTMDRMRAAEERKRQFCGG